MLAPPVRSTFSAVFYKQIVHSPVINGIHLSDVRHYTVRDIRSTKAFEGWSFKIPSLDISAWIRNLKQHR